MKFFAKLVFICNCCFVIAVILRLVENAHKTNTIFTGNIKIQPLESLLVILGYGAIYINFIFNLFLLIMFASGKKSSVSYWLKVTNFLFLIAQIYYFFFSKI
jgi:hypothetical protein